MNLKGYIKLNEDHMQQPDKDEKVAVFSFGRFSPPTKGHKRVFEKMKQVASEYNGDCLVFPSQTHDNKKNPLLWETKIQFMRELFPDVNVIQDERVKHPWSALEYLYENNYTNLYFVVGSDRVQDFERLKKYTAENFKHFEVVNAGTRDPDNDDEIGMSATRARKVALENDLAKFRAATGWKGEASKQLFEAVRKGLGEEE